jgi:hypothetical protein
MTDWLWNNRTWLFSGAGISVLLFAFWMIKKLAFRSAKSHSMDNISQNLTTNQAPVINQSPVININNPLQQPSGTSSATSDSSAFTSPPDSEGRPRIFTLPPVIEALSAESFHGAVAHFNREPITSYIARFKLAADDSNGVGHELTASIEYRELVRIPHRRGPVERLALRVGQAFWKEKGGENQIIRMGETLDLVIGLIVDSRLQALFELRGTQLPNGSQYQAVPIVVGSDPIARVTLVDVHYGWEWRVDYRMHQYPIDLRQESKLIPIRR